MDTVVGKRLIYTFEGPSDQVQEACDFDLNRLRARTPLYALFLDHQTLIEQIDGFKWVPAVVQGDGEEEVEDQWSEDDY